MTMKPILSILLIMACAGVAMAAPNVPITSLQETSTVDGDDLTIIQKVGSGAGTRKATMDTVRQFMTNGLSSGSGTSFGTNLPSITVTNWAKLLNTTVGRVAVIAADGTLTNSPVTLAELATLIGNTSPVTGLTNYYPLGFIFNTTEGVGGGGDGSSMLPFKLNIPGLNEDTTPDPAADFLATYDASGALHKKVLIQNLLTALASLGDPNVDAIRFWDDGAGVEKWGVPLPPLKWDGTNFVLPLDSTILGTNASGELTMVTNAVFRFSYLSTADGLHRAYLNSGTEGFTTNQIVVNAGFDPAYMRYTTGTNHQWAPTLGVLSNGVLVATRPKLDFEDGTNTTVRVEDVSGSDKGKVRVDVPQLPAAVPSEPGYLWHNGTHPEWVTGRSFSGLYEPFTRADTWRTVSSGAGAGVTGTDATYVNGTHWSVIKLETGTTTTGRTHHYPDENTTQYVLGGAEVHCSVWVRIPTAVSGLQDYTIRVGLGDSGTGVFTDGVWWEYDIGRTEWQLRSAAASTISTVVSNTNVDTTDWIHLRWVCNAAGTSLRGYVNGTEITAFSGTYPIVANIPTGSNYSSPGLQIIKEGTGTTTSVFYVDDFRLEMNPTGNR
jgi:hypothetical protein